MKKKKRATKPKEDKKKFDKFKVKKTKAKAKVPKILKKVKKISAPTSYKEQAEYLKKQYDRLETKFHDLVFKTMRVDKVTKYDNLEKKLYDLSINVEGEHDTLDKKLDRLTDHIAEIEGKLSEMESHMGFVHDIHKKIDTMSWQQESALHYAAENKKMLIEHSKYLKTVSDTSKTFFSEIEGEMKSRGVLMPNIHREVIDEMAESYRNEESTDRDEEEKKE